ncbi:putative ABC transport system permease protein [Stackebrandtia endophytica]|uniref:Putative ABC transport system permease protein n=1 Tax=Stackebrandtia endophytica TaxID=1496996 RepID=A0A543B1S7_9ACTN|nr:ABC transporter permease [Stackebrandtia endophytica]TQL78777.1 putative ABC transport system permease protein [Stackebrandtia endophytica]
MFLALRELSFARGRFILMGSVVVLISVLMVLLSGLSVGLINDGVSGLQKLPVTSFAFQADVDESAAFSRSVVSVEAAQDWIGLDGVADAAPFGNTLVNTRSDQGVDIDLALFGVEQGSWLEPSAAIGLALSGPGEIVVAGTLQDEGVAVGDTVTVDQIGTELEVVGFLDGQHTFGHVDVGYVDLRTWQEIHAGVRPGEPVPDHVYQDASAIAVKSADDAEADLAVGDAAAGTSSMTLEESFGASPGYTAETSTLQMIQWFLYAISALVVGAFFTVVTIQRKSEIAVLRAIGAGLGYLLRDSLTQSAILLAASTAVGVGVGVALGASIAASPMPFALETAPVALASGLLIVLGMIGAVIAVVRITRVDPLTALGGNR